MYIISKRGLLSLFFLCFCNALFSQLITTYAGGGKWPFDGQLATKANINPNFNIVDSYGNIYFSDKFYHAVRKIYVNGTIETIAGNGLPGNTGDGGLATNAQLNDPIGLAFDKSGNLFIADHGNHQIRKVSTNGIITTYAGIGVAGFSGDGGLATSAKLSSPYAVAIDKNDVLFITDNANSRIRQVLPNGIIKTIIGGNWPFNGKAAKEASITPLSIAHDNKGNIYFTDIYNSAIRKIDKNGIITTLAGGFNSLYQGDFSGDGDSAIKAKLNYPSSIILDTVGNIYFFDNGNNRIRKISTTGIITTIAGTGLYGYTGDSLLAINSQIGRSIYGMAFDSAGNFYFSDQENLRIRKIDKNGKLFNFAGTGKYGESTDGGLAISTNIPPPGGMAIDSYGNMFFINLNNGDIKKINKSGVITTFLKAGQNGYLNNGSSLLLAIDKKDNLFITAVLGTVLKVNTIGTPIITVIAGESVNCCNYGYAGDGGPAINAVFTIVLGMDIDTEGSICIADLNNYRIRKITPDGNINSISGNGFASFYGDNVKINSALINQPTGIKIDKYQNIYFSDMVNARIRMISPDSNIYTMAGSGLNGNSGNGGNALNASFNQLSQIELSSNGEIFVSDMGNPMIRKIDIYGNISSIAGTGNNGFAGDGSAAKNALLTNSTGVSVDDLSNINISDIENNRLRRVTNDGIINTIAGNGDKSNFGFGKQADSTGFEQPIEISFDNKDNLYILDVNNNCIKKIDKNGIMSLVAGTGNKGSEGNGIAAVQANLGFSKNNYWNGGAQIATDTIGNFYFTDVDNNLIRKVDPSGIITNIIGTGESGYEGDGGPASNAKINHPVGLAIDKEGNIFFTDGYTMVRKVNKNGIISTIAGSNQNYGSSGDGGLAKDAKLNYPRKMSCDSSGNLYFTENYANYLRKISKNGIISSVGTGGGPMEGFAIDNNKNIFVTDINNHQIRKVDSTGVSIVIAGNGEQGFSGDGDIATKAKLDYPRGLALNSKGALFFSDSRNNRIRKLTNASISQDYKNKFINTCSNAASKLDSFNISASRIASTFYIKASSNLEFSVNSKDSFNTIYEFNNKIDTIQKSKIFIRLKSGNKPGIYTDTIYLIARGDLVKPVIVLDTISAIPNRPIVTDTSFCQGVTANTLKAQKVNYDSLIWYGIDSTGGTPSFLAPVPNTSLVGKIAYFVSEQNSFGCISPRSKITITIKPTPNAPQINRDSAGYLKASTLNISWFKDGVILSDTSSKFKPLTAGSYTSKTLQYGCYSAASAPYYYLITDLINISSDEFIKLAPNPFINQLNFDFAVKGYQRLNIEVFDIATGSKKASMQNLTPGMPINLSQLSGGTYIIKVSSNDGKINYQFKMIKL